MDSTSYMVDSIGCWYLITSTNALPQQWRSLLGVMPLIHLPSIDCWTSALAPSVFPPVTLYGNTFPLNGCSYSNVNQMLINIFVVKFKTTSSVSWG